jgi:hypothetical protein
MSYPDEEDRKELDSLLERAESYPDAPISIVPTPPTPAEPIFPMNHPSTAEDLPIERRDGE